jgi:hypothetical protein
MNYPKKYLQCMKKAEEQDPGRNLKPSNTIHKFQNYHPPQMQKNLRDT